MCLSCGSHSVSACPIREHVTMPADTSIICGAGTVRQICFSGHAGAAAAAAAAEAAAPATARPAARSHRGCRTRACRRCSPTTRRRWPTPSGRRCWSSAARYTASAPILTSRVETPMIPAPVICDRHPESIICSRLMRAQLSPTCFTIMPATNEHPEGWRHEPLPASGRLPIHMPVFVPGRVTCRRC